MNVLTSRRAVTLAPVIGLLAIMEAAMLLSVRQESQTSDEAYTLLAGYRQLTTGDFSICPAYPPLTKVVSALPLLLLRPVVPPMTEAEASDFRGGRIFLYSNRADQVLFAARAAMTLFPLLLATLVFLAALEMFGMGAAFTALALTVFEPNLLAHGPLVTNDVAMAACLFAAVYTFWRYVRKPGPWRLAACGIAAGCALAAKHSAILLFPILFLLAVLESLLPAEAERGPASAEDHLNRVAVGGPPTAQAGVQTVPAKGRLFRAMRLLLALAAVGLISVAILWGSYGFRYSAKPVAGASPSSSLLPASGGGLAGVATSVVARFQLLPEAYLQGWAFFQATSSRPTYLFGKLYPHGVWFYFPAAVVIKSTLGFLGLLALAPLAGRRKLRVSRDAWWMLIPAVVILAASMTSHLNIGLRHILAIYPFLSVLAAAGAWKLATGRRTWQVALGGLVLFHAASSLHAFPNYLSYSNELWGGPAKTYRVLTDSNVDWGQGLPAVQRYVASHPDQPCWFAYFGTVDPAQYDIPCTLLTVSSAVIWERPLSEIPPVIQGTVLMSATEMSGQAWGPGELNPFAQFQALRPVNCLAGSVLVYQGSFAMPLDSALSKLWKVVALANRGQFDAAVAEARAAERLAPHSVDVQFVLGRALKAAGRQDESRQAFENALRYARTIYPEAQGYWIPVIEAEMGGR